METVRRLNFIRFVQRGKNGVQGSPRGNAVLYLRNARVRGQI